MIDAVMYGKTPSANSANRENAPPTNRSMNPKTLPACPCWNSDCRRRTSTPGPGVDVLRLQSLFQQGQDVHPRHGDVRPEPEQRQHPHREEELPAEVRDADDIGEPRNHAPITSARPPAASMRFRAPSL